MRIEPLGDSAYILRDLVRPAYEIAKDLNVTKPIGLIEAVASYETVGLYVDPDRFNPSDISTRREPIQGLRDSRTLAIPVCYELGPDLEEATKQLGLSSQEFVRLHSSKTYRCFAIGFCPGFPYLGYLDDAIGGLPRRASPRVRVTPGSVAITGRQTGIYPLERPGGWWLIGRTPLCLVDVNDGYFPIEAGDQVKFIQIDREEYARREGERL
jgi:inhibitor of KinA